MNKLLNLSCVVLGILLAGTSCNKENPLPGPDFSASHGILITNEGNFNANNGSITFLAANESDLKQDLFRQVNGKPLGDVVQSCSFSGSLGFIVVNNSQKVEVVNAISMKEVGYIAANYPRFACEAGENKVYLTNSGFPGEVLVIDTRTLSITDTILVGNQPEHLIRAGSRVFVANGKWGNDSTVSVIDVNTDKLIKNIVVGDGPVDLVSASDGKIWVICQGKVVYNEDFTQIIGETESSLCIIDTMELEMTNKLTIGTLGDYFNPYLLAASAGRDTIYYAEAAGVYALPLMNPVVPGKLLIPGSLYGLGVNPGNGHIFVLDAKNYSSPGELRIYDKSGDLLNTFETGIAPNGVVFY